MYGYKFFSTVLSMNEVCDVKTYEGFDCKIKTKHSRVTSYLRSLVKTFGGDSSQTSSLEQSLLGKSPQLAVFMQLKEKFPVNLQSLLS